MKRLISTPLQPPQLLKRVTPSRTSLNVQVKPMFNFSPTPQLHNVTHSSQQTPVRSLSDSDSSSALLSSLSTPLQQQEMNSESVVTLEEQKKIARQKIIQDAKDKRKKRGKN